MEEQEEGAVCAGQLWVRWAQSRVLSHPAGWGTGDGVCGLAPACDAQESTVSPHAALPWSSPFPVLVTCPGDSELRVPVPPKETREP